ncbi:MAG TPA: hypothetical protein ENF87_02905 [Thermoproteales archaeon]|nr:hypothetical protein [Thermoproteales archaeon]
MRYRLVAEKGLILCSDKEVVDFLESLYGKKEAELFKMVRKLRKSSRVSPILCSSLFLEVLEFFSKSYGVKKGGINEVYKIAREKPVVRVDIKEEEKRLIYYLQVLDEEGRVERKVL